MHWGHAVSEDLVHWQDLPIALAPTPGGPDEDGCYSGCAVVKDGVPHMVYTGVRGAAQLPCVARALDLELLTTWEKFPENPVISSPPPELNVTGFRDHSVWREGDAFYQLIGSGVAGEGGCALLYASKNLVDWDYLGPLLTTPASGTDHVAEMWECPDFFSLGHRHVLVVSPFGGDGADNPQYFVGVYRDRRFTVERQGELDRGSLFYAPQSMPDEGGRRLMWGWLRITPNEGLGARAPGWAGALSLPRVLSVTDEGRVRSDPAQELGALRSGHRRLEHVPLRGDVGAPLEGVRGESLEISALFQVVGAAEVGLRLEFGGRRTVSVALQLSNGQLSITEGGQRGAEPSTAYNPDRRAANVELRVFVDRGLIEAFAGTDCAAELVLPGDQAVIGAQAYASGGTASLPSFDVWTLDSIW